MEQKLLDNNVPLLNDDGTLRNIGYSKKFVVDFNRDAVKKVNRLKEWDYYYISDNRFGLCLTISNLAYAGVISVSVIDFLEKTHYNKTSLKLFPKKGEVVMPTTSLEGTTMFKTKDAEFKFEVVNGKRILTGYYKNFYAENGRNRDLEFEIELTNEPEESMVKATPFKKKHHFYYNQKINGMTASGRFTFDGKTYVFDDDYTLATLDWGRGVLPYKSLWYWASMQSRVEDGRVIGFNLGKAFGNNSHATENMIFFDGKAHKVGKVFINVAKGDSKKRDYMGAWTFYSDDGKVELVFEPVLDRYAPFNALAIAFIPHQVFGRYTGKLILEGGEEIVIENIYGFAERVVNRW